MTTTCQTCQSPIDLTLGKACTKCQPVVTKFLYSKQDKIPGLTAEMEDVSLAMGINPRDPSQGIISTDPRLAVSPLNSLSAKKGQAFGLSPSMMRKPVPKFDLIPKGDIYDEDGAFVDEASSPDGQLLNMNSSSAATGQAFGLSPSITRPAAKSKPMGLLREVMATNSDATLSSASPVDSPDDAQLAMGYGLPDPLYASGGRQADEPGLRRRKNFSPHPPKGMAYGLSPSLLRKARVTSLPEPARPLVQADYGPPDTQLRLIDPFGRPVASADRPNLANSDPPSPRARSPIFRGRRSADDDTDDEPKTVESEELFGAHLFIAAGSKERSPNFTRRYTSARWFRRSVSVGSGLTELSEEEGQYSRTPPQRYSLSRHSLPGSLEQDTQDLSLSAPAAIEEEPDEVGEEETEKPGKKDRTSRTREDRDRLKRWLASKLNRHANPPS